MKKKIKWIVMILVGITVILTAAFFIFVNTDKYYANETALSVVSDSVVTVTEKDGKMIFAPQTPEYGLIFYPGGKVEYHSYAPLMQSLAEKNILCVVVGMPFDLAVFAPNSADGIQDNYPSVKHWYIGGHSLGGSMAASYAANHTDELDGLILLAAYSTADIRHSGLNVISIYGSNDNVLNMDTYRKNFSLLPDNTKELVIQGGCHAYFGSYGSQKGDGTPQITAAEQVRQTTEFILKNIEEANYERIAA